MNLFRFLGGSIEAVQSIAGPNVLSHYQFQDNVCSHFFFENGAVGTIMASHTHSAQTDDPKKWAELGHDMQLILTLSKESIGVNGIHQKILINRFEDKYPQETWSGYCNPSENIRGRVLCVFTSCQKDGNTTCAKAKSNGIVGENDTLTISLFY